MFTVLPGFLLAYDNPECLVIYETQVPWRLIGSECYKYWANCLPMMHTLWKDGWDEYFTHKKTWKLFMSRNVKLPRAFPEKVWK